MLTDPLDLAIVSELYEHDPSSSDGIYRASILGVEPFCLKHRSLVHETWSEIIWQSVPLGQVDQ